VSGEKRESEYLGYTVGNNKIAKDKSALNKISKWGKIKNVNELRKFSGITSYLRKFIPTKVSWYKTLIPSFRICCKKQNHASIPNM
jgi:hypothetical protein